MKAPQLFSPGPTPMSDASLKILSRPPIHHRSEEFQNTLENAYSKLDFLFGDRAHKCVFTSTGTGALEASVINFTTKKSNCLYLDGGKFGERWGEILKTYGINSVPYKVSWGEVPDLEQLKKTLQDGTIDVFFMQACETSTSTAYDVKKIGALIQKVSPETLFVVDGITALGAYPLSLNEDHIDVLISGSQKALGLPVGLSFLGFNEKAYLKAKDSDHPKYYFDVLKEVENLKNSTTTFSSPTQIWLALEHELTVLSEGDNLNKKYELCLKAQKMIHDFVEKEPSLKLFSQSPSPSLTAIAVSQSAKKIQKELLNRGYFVAAGQGDYKDKIIRIGHMANIDLKSLEQLLNELQTIIKES